MIKDQMKKEEEKKENANDEKDSLKFQMCENSAKFEKKSED